MTPTLESGVRYIVTKGSDDGTLMIGEHVWLDNGGCLQSREGQGWIDPENVAEVLIGVEVAIDREWLAACTRKMIREIAELRRLLLKSKSVNYLPELSWITVGMLEATFEE